MPAVQRRLDARGKAAALIWLLAVLLSIPTGAEAKSKDDPPIFTASRDCAVAWRRYHSHFNPMHFALSRDGRSCAYSLCPTKCRRSRDAYQVVLLCEAAAGDRPCALYGLYGAVVSEDAITPGGAAGD